MSVADQLMAKGHAAGHAEGEAKGRAEGLAAGEAKGRAADKVEVVEGLLRNGVGWDVIEAATGLDETAFQALREQVAPRS